MRRNGRAPPRPRPRPLLDIPCPPVPEVEPSQELLDKADVLLLKGGPLPSGDRFIVLQHRPHQTLYLSKARPHDPYDKHPRTHKQPSELSAQPIRAPPQGQPATCPGYIQPEAFHEDTFRWIPHHCGSYAVADAMLAFNRKTGRSTFPEQISVEEVVDKLHRHYQQGDDVGHMVHDPKMYHPMDGHRTPKDEETLMAFAVRAFGLSLVLVHTDVEDMRDFFAYDLPSRALTTRWSVGEDYDLYPPLYVGYNRHIWYHLEPYNALWYDRFSPTAPHNSWETMYTMMRHEYDISLTLTGFIKLAVRIYRFASIGFDVAPGQWEAALLRYLHSALRDRRRSDLRIIQSLKGSLRHADPPRLTKDHLTSALECGDSAVARDEAKRLDLAIKVFLNKSTGDNDHKRQAMRNALSDLKRFTLDQESSYEAPPAGKGAFQRWQAIVQPVGSIEASKSEDTITKTASAKKEVQSAIRVESPVASSSELSEASSSENARKDGRPIDCAPPQLSVDSTANDRADKNTEEQAHPIFDTQHDGDMPASQNGLLETQPDEELHLPQPASAAIAPSDDGKQQKRQIRREKSSTSASAPQQEQPSLPPDTTPNAMQALLKLTEDQHNEVQEFLMQEVEIGQRLEQENYHLKEKIAALKATYM